MRELSDYSAVEWLKADPLTHGFKRARNVAIERLSEMKTENVVIESGFRS